MKKPVNLLIPGRWLCCAIGLMWLCGMLCHYFGAEAAVPWLTRLVWVRPGGPDPDDPEGTARPPEPGDFAAEPPASLAEFLAGMGAKAREDSTPGYDEPDYSADRREGGHY